MQILSRITASLETLEGIGGKRRTKDDKDHLYFNDWRPWQA